jgi:hypothetical protein
MPSSPARQTVLAGPIDPINHWPDLFDDFGRAQGMTPATRNISPTHPLIVTAAHGFNSTGAVDRVGISTSNLTWPQITVPNPDPEFPTDFSFYLYVDVHPDGSLLPGLTALEPIYQEDGTPSTVLDQCTYNIIEAKMHVGDGQHARPVWRVFLAGGWGSTPGGISAYRPLAFGGRWSTGLLPFPEINGYCRPEFTAMPGDRFVPRWVAVCLTADGEYRPGNELALSSFGGYFTEVRDHSGYLRLDTADTLPLIRNDLGVRVPITPSHWQLRCYLTRAW